MTEPSAGGLRALLRFAFYGRVSTEDNQDPGASRAWQLARALSTVDGHGTIVEEYFDIGQSRSLPWKRRPQAGALLHAVASPDRTFDAIVVGEPHRAFYGPQFSLTFPILTHYGVTLWIPEVGGEIDPASEVQDLMMTLFGGMAKGDLARTRVRVQTTMGEMVRINGRFMGGRTPHGYALADNGPHPNLNKARDGKRLKRLVSDPATAGAILRIFDEYNRGVGLRTIADGLNADRIPCPSEANPGQNPGRAGNRWHHSTVRAILQNRRYTGHEQWAKTRKHEVLLDPLDVAAGYITRQRRNPTDKHVLAPDLTHEPIITLEAWETAQRRLQTEQPAPTRERTPRRTARPYPLAGLIRCGVCHRKMAGSRDPRSGRVYYRCLGKNVTGPTAERHPRTVNLPETAVIPALDTWISRMFAPEHLDQTATQLAANTGPGLAETGRRAAAQARLDAATKALKNFERLAAEGADPALVVSWTNKALADQRTAQADLAAHPPAAPTGPDAIKARLEALGDIPALLAASTADDDPAAAADKNELYNLLAVALVYDPDERVVHADAGLQGAETPAAGTNPAPGHVTNGGVRGGT